MFYLAQVTDGFVTADEDEETPQGASDRLGSVAKAAKESKKKANSTLGDLKTGLGDAADRDGNVDVDAEEAGGSGDLSAHLAKGVEGGKVDVSYV